jgi:hypothetical protein
MNNEEIDDIKTVLNEQMLSIYKLKDLINEARISGTTLLPVAVVVFIKEILECNEVIAEIINGPTGGIEKVVERTKLNNNPNEEIKPSPKSLRKNKG